MAIKGFFEDYEGEIALSDIRNFKDEKDFMESAEKYVQETRGYKVPLFKPLLRGIVFNHSDDDDCWRTKKYAQESGFTGEEITVYWSIMGYDNSKG